MDDACHSSLEKKRVSAPKGERPIRRRCVSAGWRNGLWLIEWADGTLSAYRVAYEP